jgi:DNA repair protein RadC
MSVVRVELVKDWGHPYANREIDTPKDLVAVLRKFLAKTDREVFLTVNLSGINEINNINIVSVGCLTHTIVDPRDYLKLPYSLMLLESWSRTVTHPESPFPHRRTSI